jgi:hypothetical protein
MKSFHSFDSEALTWRTSLLVEVKFETLLWSSLFNAQVATSGCDSLLCTTTVFASCHQRPTFNINTGLSKHGDDDQVSSSLVDLLDFPPPGVPPADFALVEQLSNIFKATRTSY